MKAFNFKMIFSTVLLVASSFVEQTAMAKSNPPMYYKGSNVYECRRTIGDLFPYVESVNKTSAENNAAYDKDQRMVEDICSRNENPYFVMCAMDLVDSTYIGRRNANGETLKWGDYRAERRGLGRVKTIEDVCAGANSLAYNGAVACVSDLFLKGGIPMASDNSSAITGVRLCASGSADLTACIIQKYQSGNYTGARAATECANALGLSLLVGTTSTTTQTSDADARAAREAYNRAQAERRAAEAKKQQQQQPQAPKQSEQKKTPAPGSSSSGSVIEDLPTL